MNLIFKIPFIERIVRKWCLKNYPLETTTLVTKEYQIFVKKGKIREWRIYDENHNRIG